VIYIVPIIS